MKFPIPVWIGCTSRRYLKEPVSALKKLLSKVDMKMERIDTGELCCGSVLYTTGQEIRAEQNRIELEKLLKKLKIKEMVLLCPGCTRTFNEYFVPRKNNPLKKVNHYTQILSEHLEMLNFKSPSKKGKIRITYHDPCHLGRHMGIYEEPRSILKSLPNIEFIELPQALDESFCCGSGGGVRAYNKELADNASTLRLKEAASIDAKYLITSCPFCERSFYAAQEKNKELRSVKVENLAVFILRYL